MISREKLRVSLLKVWTRRRASTMEAGAHSHASMLAGRGIPPLMHSFSACSPGNTATMLSPREPTVYSSEETVESVIGNRFVTVDNSQSILTARFYLFRYSKVRFEAVLSGDPVL